jgi:hypothetical protein
MVYLLFLTRGTGAVKSYKKLMVADTTTNLGFGTRLSAVYDVNGDSVPDVIASAVNAGYGGSGRGAVHALMLPTVLGVSADVDECFLGVHNCHALHGVCINTNGSFACLCASNYMGDGVSCGEFVGAASPLLTLTTMNSSHIPSGGLLRGLAIGPDWNGDHTADIAWSYAAGGVVFIGFLAPTATGLLSYARISSSDAVFSSAQISSSDVFGVSLSVGGDIDGDLHPDLAVGAPGDGEKQRTVEDGARLRMPINLTPVWL